MTLATFDKKVSTRKKAGRKTDAERAAIKIENMKLERFHAQESKRAKLVQIDTLVVLVGWLIAVAIAFLTSAVISYNGITAVSVEVGLSFAWMAGLFFFFVEFMYLITLVAYLVLSSRADEKTKGVVVLMNYFAGVAILANAYHTFQYHDWDFASPNLWIGVVLSVTAPIAILSISKVASRMVFAKAIRL